MRAQKWTWARQKEMENARQWPKIIIMHGDDHEDDDGLFPFHINEQTADDTPVIFVVVVRLRKANKICLLFSLLSPFKLVFVLSIWRENNELSFSRSFSLCFLLSRCLFVHSLYWEIEMGVKRPCGWMFLIRTSSQNLVTQCLQLHNNNYCCCFLCINLLSDFNFVPFLSAIQLTHINGCAVLFSSFIFTLQMELDMVKASIAIWIGCGWVSSLDGSLHILRDFA